MSTEATSSKIGWNCSRCGIAFTGPEAITAGHKCRPFTILDAALIWFAMFGVWPLFDPAHNFDTFTGAIDLVLHFAAWYWLVKRWRIVRRSRPPFESLGSRP